tara:strand:- start:613 stop:876 length:264 start_codon:yes stop_codon:yes gene_type:complete
MKAPVTKREAIERIAEMSKEIKELEEIIAGARLNEENLLHYLTNICAIIDLQMPLKYQDQFVEEMKDLGLYDPKEGFEDDDDVVGLA